MDYLRKRLALTGVLLMGLPLLGSGSAYAAMPVDLSHQQLSALQSFVSESQLKETSRNVSRANMTHIRVQQTYNGHKVWGADAVIHMPHSGATMRKVALENVISSKQPAKMNGTIYKGIEKDLAMTRAFALTPAQANKAMNLAVQGYKQKLNGVPAITNQSATQVVFIDDNNKARWAYLVSF